MKIQAKRRARTPQGVNAVNATRRPPSLCSMRMKKVPLSLIELPVIHLIVVDQLLPDNQLAAIPI